MTTLSSNNPFRKQVEQDRSCVAVGPGEAGDVSGAHSPLRPGTPQRGSRESSPARSEYAASIPELSDTAQGGVKIFDLFHTKSRLDIRICDAATGTCVYYVDNSSFKPRKPDVTLLAGEDKHGSPIVGVARWSLMHSKHIEIGLGDPGHKSQNSIDIPWESLEADSRLKQREHKWCVPNDPKRQVYIWKRTHHDGVEAQHSSWSSTNFKLVDEKTGEILATFGSNRYKSWHKVGKLTMRTGMGNEWELMALLGCLSLLEKSRRRARARRGGGAGGGGGSGS